MMLNNDENLNEYLSERIDKLIKKAIKATLQNTRESLFLARYSLSASKAASIRNTYRQAGKHVPPFFIAGITKGHDLFCKHTGAGEAERDDCRQEDLPADEWGRIFKEASDLGIGLVFLTGEEPLKRRDVIEEAAQHRSIVFPVLTDGKMVREYETVFDQSRNLIPVLNLRSSHSVMEEKEELFETMDHLKKMGIFFGVSVTAKKDNIDEITGDAFMDFLKEKGANLIMYSEDAAIGQDKTAGLSQEEVRERLNEKITELDQREETLLFLKFPVDKQVREGCLAGGRGFFYVNSVGEMEPCPFSCCPVGSLRGKPLIEVLNAPMFKKMQENKKAGCSCQ